MHLHPPKLIVVLLALLAYSSQLCAGERAWTYIPVGQWKGNTRAEVAPLKKTCAVAVAYPSKEASALTCVTADASIAGLYEARLKDESGQCVPAGTYRSRPGA